MTAPRPGNRIGDRYQLVRRIAVGGMGEVWEAWDHKLGRRVAVKLLKPELSADPEFLDRFRDEARTAASMNHRNIAAVFDFGEDGAGEGAQLYLVMELVSGQPLSTKLDTGGALTPEETLDLLEQAGRALQAAHDHRFVHRDIKPANILLADDGVVKLTDFGIAKPVNSPGLTESGMVLGTAHYIAPEQARGEDAGPASDVYSLGVVGWECLAGYRPFRGNDPVSVATKHLNDPVPSLPTDVPAEFRTLVQYALVKDPKRRYRDGAEFVEAVAALRRGEPARAPSMRPMRPARRPSPRAGSAGSKPSPRPGPGSGSGDKAPAAGPAAAPPAAPSGAAAPPAAAPPAAAPPAAPAPAAARSGSATDSPPWAGGSSAAVPIGVPDPQRPPAPPFAPPGGPASPPPYGAGPFTPRPQYGPGQPGPVGSGRYVPGPWSGPVYDGFAAPGPDTPPPAPPAKRGGTSLLTWAFILLTIAAVVVGVLVVRKAVQGPAPAAPDPAGLGRQAPVTDLTEALLHRAVIVT